MKKLALSTAILVAFAAPGMAGAEQIQATLIGYEEVPALSTPASGQLRAMVTNHDQFIDYELTYSGLTGEVRQAHIHFGQHSVNGGIAIWLCGTGDPGTAFAGPAGTPTCPQEGTVTGTAGMAQVIGPAGQGIDAGDLEAAIAAIRAGTGYANVHSSRFGGGEIRGQIRASSRP
jgi:hypothetical protein